MIVFLDQRPCIGGLHVDYSSAITVSIPHHLDVQPLVTSGIRVRDADASANTGRNEYIVLL